MSNLARYSRKYVNLYCLIFQNLQTELKYHYYSSTSCTLNRKCGKLGVSVDVIRKIVTSGRKKLCKGVAVMEVSTYAKFHCIRNGKVLDVSPFSFDNEVIPSIHSNPVKFLGRSIDVTITDREAVNAFKDQVFHGLDLIDKSFHRGIHKVWILQHLFIPRLRWPLLIYEISVSVVLQLEQKISCLLRKWLKLHHSTTNICLYSSISPCPLPIKSLTSVLKAAKVSGHLLLRESSDEFVSSCNPTLKSGFWDVAEAVITAESKLEFQKLLGYHQTNRAGFGYFHQPETPAKHSHAYRKLVYSVLVEEDDEVFRAKAVQLHLQGYWMRWCDFMKNDLSWKTLLGMPSSLLSFCLNATYGTLPSPSNLKRWQITTESSCFLCHKIVCTNSSYFRCLPNSPQTTTIHLQT